MPTEPWVWVTAGTVITILLLTVGYLIRRDRQAITDEARRNHQELSKKIDKVESDLSIMMVQYVPRHEFDAAQARQLDVQRHERAEMKGYFTAMIQMVSERLGRIETKLDAKADKP